MEKEIKDLVTYNEIEYDRYKSFEAIVSGQVIGKCNYSTDSGKAWLYIVKVADTFRQHGIGGNLVKLMENDCVQKRVREIEGKYFPQGAEDHVVRSFYEKHGFSIYDDGYEHFVFKGGLEKQDVSGLKVTKSKGIEK